jgi:hypothetical protein
VKKGIVAVRNALIEEVLGAELRVDCFNINPPAST